MNTKAKNILSALSLIVILSSSVVASEEDYDLTGYDAPAVSVVHQGSPAALSKGIGSEADLFTYKSSTYAPVKIHKTSMMNKKCNDNKIDPLYSMTNK
jgi:hypothetical protein